VSASAAATELHLPAQHRWSWAFINPHMPHWSNTFFGEDYQKIYQDRTLEQAQSEAEFFLKEAGLATSAEILDVGCGAGLHLAALSPHIAHGIGIDISTVQLASANELKETLDLTNIEFQSVDMRTFSFVRQFDAISFFFTTFGYFSDEENEQVLSRCASHLKNNGTLFLDLQNRALLEERFRKNDIQRTIEQFQGIDVVIEQKMDRITKRLYQSIRCEELHIQLEGDWRVYDKSEIERLLMGHGFQISCMKGAYADEPFSLHSRRMLVFAKRI